MYKFVTITPGGTVTINSQIMLTNVYSSGGVRDAITKISDANGVSWGMKKAFNDSTKHLSETFFHLFLPFVSKTIYNSQLQVTSVTFYPL